MSSNNDLKKDFDSSMGKVAKHTLEDKWHIVEFAGFFEFTDAPFYTANSLLDLDKCPQAKENADRLLECLKALQGFSSEQIAQIRAWANTPETNLMFDYVAKNRLLEAENERLKNVLKEIGNTFKPLELSMWDFVDILRDKAKQAYKEETKPDFNQNSMLERFGELEDEFKVE